VLEEVQFGQQAFDADELPTSRRAELHVEFAELRDVVLADAHRVLALQELVAGAALEQFALTPEQRLPDAVVGGRVAVPGLLDHAGGVDRHIALVGGQVFDALRLGHGADR
jgi:hypothetical protein